MMRLHARSIVLLVLAMFAVGCGSDTIGTGEDGGDFVGDDPSGSDPGGDPPESGQSACSMFDPSTCENDEACTPTSQSIRVCEPEAVLDVGAACDPASDTRCVGGALCFGAHHNGSFCMEVCDTTAPSCPDGQTCTDWVEIDGESLGYCNSDR